MVEDNFEPCLSLSVLIHNPKTNWGGGGVVKNQRYECFQGANLHECREKGDIGHILSEFSDNLMYFSNWLENNNRVQYYLTDIRMKNQFIHTFTLVLNIVE